MAEATDAIEPSCQFLSNMADKEKRLPDRDRKRSCDDPHGPPQKVTFIGIQSLYAAGGEDYPNRAASVEDECGVDLSFGFAGYA